MSKCCTVAKDSKTSSEILECSKHQDVREYYGQVLRSSSDLKTNVCTTDQYSSNGARNQVRRILKEIHPEVIDRYYGCGVPIPECIVGSRVLDLGSGSGRDCYVLSKIVGEEGKVTGVDMTDEQLAIACKYIDYHTEKFGYKIPNVEFVKGFIENLKEAGIESNHYDVAVSNCVVNLSPNKESVLKEVYRVLKDGGELFFSDIYSDQRLSDELKTNKVLWGECVSGALYWKDFVQMAQDVGFTAPQLVNAHYVETTKGQLKELVGEIKFVSATYRLFKLIPSSDSTHGHQSGTVTYLGTIEEFPDEISFSYDIQFHIGISKEVNYDTAAFLNKSRYANHFKITFNCSSKKESKEIFVTSNPFDVAEKKQPKKRCCD